MSRDGRLVGVLEVSRSIGDGAFKMHGVSSTPDVKKCQLSNDDRSVRLIIHVLEKMHSRLHAFLTQLLLSHLPGVSTKCTMCRF